MTTKRSRVSRQLHCGVSWRALAIGSASADNRLSENNQRVRCRTRKSSRIFVAVVSLEMMAAFPAFAQAPPLGTAASFGVLAGSTVTNTGPTVINGNVGVWPGVAVVGFPPGAVVPPFAIHAGDAVAQQAQLDNTTAYNNLAARSVTSDKSGQDLGGQILIAGVYGFTAAAQLTGQLTLDGQGNPNSVFIFKIGSDLTTASASSILLTNGAQGANVFFQVGSSAVLGTSTSFVGDILALQSITLNTNATISCGAAWAQNGAVTLDSNIINICMAAAISATMALPPDASANQLAVANAINAFVANGGILPQGFLDLLTFLSPEQLAAAFTQLSGEAATGAAPAAAQAMNSFLSMLTSPFSSVDRPFDNNRPDNVVKALGFAPERGRPAASAAFESFDRSGPQARWGVWASAYGSQGRARGDPLGTGTHDRTATAYGYATGLDYRVNPYLVAGFALSGGSTRYGLSDGLGGGKSDMFQAAVYATARFDAAYVSAALAYAWHGVTTSRTLTVLGLDHLVADYDAHSLAARIEGGYRYALPGPAWGGRSGITPYAAAQLQTFYMPSYSETANSGSPLFALAYEARSSTTGRTELGAWFDWSTPTYYGGTAVVRSRLAWAHDFWPSQDVTASFVALPGSQFTVTGASPPSDLLLASAGVENYFRNGFSSGVRFDSELASHSPKYAATGYLRYTW